jgi:hypothetical protein
MEGSGVGDEHPNVIKHPSTAMKKGKKRRRERPVMMLLNESGFHPDSLHLPL